MDVDCVDLEAHGLLRAAVGGGLRVTLQHQAVAAIVCRRSLCVHTYSNLPHPDQLALVARQMALLQALSFTDFPNAATFNFLPPRHSRWKNVINKSWVNSIA
eukprot:355343-Chlamydomonas_euryale.AAC.4